MGKRDSTSAPKTHPAPIVQNVRDNTTYIQLVSVGTKKIQPILEPHRHIVPNVQNIQDDTTHT